MFGGSGSGAGLLLPLGDAVSELSAGQLVDLADRVRALRQEVGDAGFGAQSVRMNILVAAIEQEAGKRAIKELRRASHESEAA